MTEVRALCICARSFSTPLTPTLTATPPCTVSRLYAHSKNYDMELTLDYNIELFPLQAGQSFALALASSLSRIPQGVAGAADDEEKDRDVWRPDAKGRRGLDDDYEYVMYGKVSTLPTCTYPTTFAFVCFAFCKSLPFPRGEAVCLAQHKRLMVPYLCRCIGSTVVPRRSCKSRPFCSSRATTPDLAQLPSGRRTHPLVGS